MSSIQLKMGVRAWHEELLEFIIAHPRASGSEIAFHFNVTESWVSIVKNSDAFKELWAQRRGEHFSRVSATITEKVTALAEVTVDAMTDKIEKDKQSPTGAKFSDLKDAADLALKSLGFGNRGVPQVNINNGSSNTTNVFVDKDVLARAREAKANIAEKFEPKIIEHRDTESEQGGKLEGEF